MRGALSALILSLAAAGAQAQALHKCVDGGGRVTYSSDPCDKLGLQSSGPVRERLTILPSAAAAPKPAAPAPRPEASPKPSLEPGPQPAAKVAPINPLIQKLIEKK